MKRLLRLLGLVDLVWVTDHMGEKYLRVVWHDKATSERYVYGFCGPTITKRVARLLPDGKFDLSLSGGLYYLTSWVEYGKAQVSQERRLTMFR